MSVILSGVLLKLKAYFVNKGRLVMEYTMIFAVIVLGVFSINFYIQDKLDDEKVIRLEQKISDQSVKLFALEEANNAQTDTINKLLELRTRDATAIQGLVNDYKSLADTSNKVDKRLKQLESSNEAVRIYLSSDIPAPLMCLLNNTCSATNGDKN